MTPTETTTSLQAFFDSYGAAFERLDAAAIAEHYAYPSHITSDADDVDLIPIATKQGCARVVERVLAPHRRLGTPSGRILELAIAELSPRLAAASLHWEVHEETGVLYRFEATYTLARIGGTWRIAATSHNQMPRLQACVSERSGARG